jgi:MFS family permease
VELMSERAEPAPSFNRDAATWAAYLLLGLFAYVETVVGPAMPFIRERLDLGYLAASAHFSAFALGSMAVGLTGDRLVRRWGRRTALWGGIAGMVAGGVLLAVSPHIVGSLLGVFLMGSAGTISLISNQATLADLHRGREAQALSESNVVASSAAILAPLAIGGFASIAFLGWQFALLLTVPVLFLLYWRCGNASIPAARTAARSATGNQTLSRTFWLLWGVLFLVMSVEWCMAYWGANFLADVVGLRPSAAAMAMSIFFAAMILGRLIGSRLTRRYRGLSILLAAIAIAIVGFPLFWLGPTPLVSLIGLFVAGFGIANFYPLTVAAAAASTSDSVDLATTRLAISGGGALLLSPLLVGAIAALVGMRWGFGVVVPLLLGALVILAIIRRQPQPEPVVALVSSETENPIRPSASI